MSMQTTQLLETIRQLPDTYFIGLNGSYMLKSAALEQVQLEPISAEWEYNKDNDLHLFKIVKL